VPSDAEWTVLTDFLGGESVAGGKMKTTGAIEEGSGLWHSPNAGALNLSGFSGVPGSFRYSSSEYDAPANNGHWWSSTESEIYGALYRYLINNSENSNRTYNDKAYGFSVRCLRD
jgi:uncharacterized protein (TIGR02145 family)